MAVPEFVALKTWVVNKRRTFPIADTYLDSAKISQKRLGYISDEFRQECIRLLDQANVDYNTVQRLMKESSKRAAAIEPRVGSHELFVTISFDPDRFVPASAVDGITRLLNAKYVCKATAVFEFNTHDGGHPHVHILMESDKPKSVVLQSICKAKYIQSLVSGDNFIDVKVGRSFHQSYIEGNKREEKMQYVQMDYEWRELNNIPHSIEV